MDNSSGASFPATLSYVSFVIGIISFIITVLNLLALYANFIATIRSAPIEIRDALGNLRAQLLEEREALRQQTRELRNKKAQMREGRQRSLHPAHAGRARSSSRNGLSPRPSSGNLRGGMHTYALNYSEQTLGLHYQTVRDLWRQFKSLERPFLVSSGTRAEAIRNGDVWVEKDLVDEKTLREDIELHGESGSFADWSAFYRCDFTHRFIWWQNKSDVVKLADEVQRVMLRRMEREVTCMRMMLKQLRDGGDGPEDIASPRFDGGGGGGGATTSGRAGSRGPVPLGMRRRPTAENYNVYESSESSSSTTGPKSQRRPDERDPRVHVSEVRQSRPPSRAGPELRYNGEGWRQGQFTRVVQLSPRGTAPPILEPPRPSRPRTRSGYDGPPGPPSPYDRRR
ncbi:hypothetical protein J7T55_009936 [Diaporthe amygdali]|uniref:uncharacterized protein n=1 Tax=Phomopsis amygdali TaxID=1214568 RepID=UPI0022FE2EF5|nr:uncharacterized protein J7T55_009936 [Diaporthe amygdali]KAJ0116785.1 hypothetical protein J7T55_009936 [Diaporthe amygdali]